MPTNICQRTAMAAAIAACFPASAFAAGVARVDFAAGSVSATAPDGRTRALTKGSEIEVGETVQTQQGRAQLRFADGAYMSLQPQTEFKVEEFKYSGNQDASDNIVMNLLKGGLRTITGLIGRNNRNAYRLKTDVATIGIRGTEYSVKYTNSIEVFVADGAVGIENQAGSFTIPGGTGVLISNDQTPPQQTDQKPVLPPETPLYEEQQQLTDQVPPPVNPIQESQQQTILTGTITGNWAVSVSAGFGVVANDIEQTLVLDAAGVLTSFTNTDGFEFPSGLTTIGSNAGLSEGNDGIIAWGRWAGGTTGGDNPLDLTDLTGEGPSPLHYVVGLPATNLPPLGTMATYSMIGATVPSIYSGFSSASVIGSSLVVHFGTSSAFLNVAFNIDGSVVSGSDIFLNLNGARLNGSGGLFSGGFCGGINAAGFLAGEGGVRAGLAYVVDGCGMQNCGAFNGAIAYQRGALAPSNLQVLRQEQLLLQVR